MPAKKEEVKKEETTKKTKATKKKEEETKETKSEPEMEVTMEKEEEFKEQVQAPIKRPLIKKIAEVMLEVKYIQRTGKNDFQNYTYPTERDIVEKIRVELAKRNVILVPDQLGYKTRELSTKKGNLTIYTVDMEYTFIDAETGDTLSYRFSGEGQDNADKAIYKAYTGAQKYALLKLFMLPTGDEPEQDNSDIEVTASRKGVISSGSNKIDRINELFTQITNNGADPNKLKGYLEQQIGRFNRISELSDAKQQKALKVLESLAQQQKAN